MWGLRSNSYPNITSTNASDKKKAKKYGFIKERVNILQSAWEQAYEIQCIFFTSEIEVRRS